LRFPYISYALEQRKEVTMKTIAVGDFNGDGFQDLAVANCGSNNVSLLMNNTPRQPPPFGENK